MLEIKKMMTIIGLVLFTSVLVGCVSEAEIKAKAYQKHEAQQAAAQSDRQLDREVQRLPQ